MLDAVNSGRKPAYLADGGEVARWWDRRPQWGRELDGRASRLLMSPSRALHERVKRAAGIAPPPRPPRPSPAQECRRPAEMTTARTMTGGSEAPNGLLVKALQEFAQKGPALASALNGFGGAAERLIDALKTIPEKIEMEGRHDVTVNVTGVEGAGQRDNESLRPFALDVIHDAFDRRGPDSNGRGPW